MALPCDHSPDVGKHLLDLAPGRGQAPDELDGGIGVLLGEAVAKCRLQPLLDSHRPVRGQTGSRDLDDRLTHR